MDRNLSEQPHGSALSPAVARERPFLIQPILQCFFEVLRVELGQAGVRVLLAARDPLKGGASAKLRREGLDA